MNSKIIRQRHTLTHSIRDFFDSRDYLEVETPILSTQLIPEPTIENFSTMYTSEFRTSQELYLIPSPEVYMKKLLAQGIGSIYQITKCFRNREQVGIHHEPEFSMLEWYTVGIDHKDSIALTQEFIQATALPEPPEHIKAPFRILTMAELCKTLGGFDLEKVQTSARLRETAEKLGLMSTAAPDYESWADTFNRIFLSVIEPGLPQDRPLVITDYPEQIDCLARKVPGKPWRERWELYAGGIELANCYHEETDPREVERYYRKASAELYEARTISGGVIPDIDQEYFRVFESSFPASSGVALGLDRLLMLETGTRSIEGVILFSLSDTMGWQKA